MIRRWSTDYITLLQLRPEEKQDTWSPHLCFDLFHMLHEGGEAVCGQVGCQEGAVLLQQARLGQHGGEGLLALALPGVVERQGPRPDAKILLPAWGKGETNVRAGL